MGPAIRHILAHAEWFTRQNGRAPSPDLGDRLMVGSLDFAHTVFRELYDTPPSAGEAIATRVAMQEFMEPDRPLHFIHEKEPIVFGLRLEVDMDQLGDAYRAEKQPAPLDPETAAAVERGKRVIFRDGKPMRGNGGRI